MRVFQCVLPVAPVAKARARVTRNGTFTPEKTREFERAVFWHLRALKAPLLSGAVWIEATFVLERPKARAAQKRLHPTVRSDIDNYFKALADAANGTLWHDDSQIVHAEIRKIYGSPARIELGIGEVE